MKTITLFRGPNAWMARIDGDPDITALFGSNVIPTAFLPRANPDKVRREIMSLNPGATVILQPE